MVQAQCTNGTWLIYEIDTLFYQIEISDKWKRIKGNFIISPCLFKNNYRISFRYLGKKLYLCIAFRMRRI